MDSEQLQQAVEHIVRKKYYFKIISSRELNSLSIKKGETSFIVIHIASPEANSKVGHFVLVEFNRTGKIIFFDSYGLDPISYLEHVPFHVTDQIPRQIQDNKSEICGLYIIYYMCQRVYLKKSLQQIYQPFSADTRANDKFIKNFAARYGKKLIKKPRTQESPLKSICMCDYILCMTHNAI